MILIFFWKIIVLIFAIYCCEQKFDTSLQKIDSSWKKNIHSRLVPPTVKYFYTKNKCNHIQNCLSLFLLVTHLRIWYSLNTEDKTVISESTVVLPISVLSIIIIFALQVYVSQKKLLWLIMYFLIFVSYVFHFGVVYCKTIYINCKISMKCIITYA